mgnify:FL=1
MKIKDKVRSAILSRTTNDQRVGIELESIIYTNNNQRLSVNQCDYFTATDLLNILNDNKNENGLHSLEPGGQLEWSSPAFFDLNDLQNSLSLYRALLDSVLLDKELKLIDYGLDPIFLPEQVELINQKKYILMDKHMGESGTMGKWMMRSTASIQINLDSTCDKNMEEIAFISDCLNPVASYLFANCPYKENKKTGRQNIRQVIWDKTDDMRCRNLFDHGIFQSNALIDKYTDYILSVPSIFKLDRFGKISESEIKIGERLVNLSSRGEISERDIQAGLHQIFTNVRLKGLVEIRGADRTPVGYEIAPAAFWIGLLYDEKTREKVNGHLSQWSTKDRKLFNRCASELSLDQEGPQGKPYGDWIYIFSDYAIEGLVNRELGEEKLFQKFYNCIIEHGPFSLKVQSDESTHYS